MPTFESLSQNNPYSKENRAQYKVGTFENLFRKWGFRTNYDKYNEEMDNRANEYEAQLRSTQREEEYNSAEAQAARMRNAGLNPDLADNMPGAGEATPMTEPDYAPESPTGDYEIAGEHAARLGTFLLDTLIGGGSVFSAITGGIKALTESKNTATDTEAKELGIDSDTLDLIEKAHEMYGNLSKESDLKSANGAYMAKMMGLSGKKFAKVAQGYDMLYNQIPSALNRREGQFKEDILDKTHAVQKYQLENAAMVEEINAKYNIQKLEIINNQPEKLQRYIEEELKQPGASNAALRAGAINQTEQARVTKVAADIAEATREQEIEIQKADLQTIKEFNKEIEETKWYEAAWPIIGTFNKGKKLYRYIRASKRKYGKDTSGATETITGTAAAAAGGAFAGGKSIGKIGFKTGSR